MRQSSRIANTLVILFFCVALIQCIDPYSPPEIKSDVSYLVVDAFMDSGTGEIVVTLSRTVPLDTTVVVTESNAIVTLEVKSGQTIPLSNMGNGKFSFTGITGSTTDEYRLKIRTADGKEYYSDFVRVKETPPIDSITWEAGSRKLSINVTTHDFVNNSRFYRWRYEETFQYRSGYQSNVYYNASTDQVVPRYVSDTLAVYECWKTSLSTNILVATSKNLSQDVINKFAVVELDADSWKHKIKYSLLLKQYAIDEAEYNYWNQLKKTTESVGTIFDPQPSQITGNLHCSTDPDEPVLGYFSVSSVVEQRIFINTIELPYTQYVTPYGSCYLDTVLLADFWLNPRLYPLVNEVVDDSNTLIGYTTASNECIDCRMQGGRNTKPDFWQ